MSSAVITALALMLASLAAPAVCYPDGAPSGACSAMFPQHGDMVHQRLASPYTVLPSSTTYSPGGSLQVTINGTVPFMGFMIQARAIGSTTTDTATIGAIVGSFLAGPSTKAVCNTATGSGALTHSSRLATRSLTLTWMAPAFEQGAPARVEFIVSVVQSYSTFWVQERSAVVSDAKSMQPDNSFPQWQVPSYFPDVSLSGCGQTKSCIHDPPNCVDLACGYILTWRKVSPTTVGAPAASTAIQFELQATDADYVAVGFSSSRTMEENSMVACVKTSSGAVIRQLYSTTFRTPSAVSARNLYNGVVSTESGRIKCSFIWNNDAAARGRREVFDLSTPYYVTLAKGDAALNSAGDIRKHSERPRVSAEKLSMTADRLVPNGSIHVSVNWLVKAHGAIMVLAWVLCASTGVFITRYYKRMWLGSTHCGEKAWFTWHRILMLLCMFLTVIGVIIIFVSVGGWTKLHPSADLPQAAHPILGIIAACLSVLNPILAAFRCNPVSKKRPIFNWLHWFFGTAAYVFAVVCVFLGLMFPQAQVPWWLLWVFAAFCMFQFLWEIILEIHQCCLYDKNKTKEEEYALKHKGDARVSEPPYSGRGFKCVMFIVYMIVVITVSLTIAIVILTHSA